MHLVAVCEPKQFPAGSCWQRLFFSVYSLISPKGMTIQHLDIVRTESPFMQKTEDRSVTSHVTVMCKSEFQLRSLSFGRSGCLVDTSNLPVALLFQDSKR